MNAGWETAEQVLCIRLDSMGDLLMTTPALRALKESRPGRKLTLLTSSRAAEAASLVEEAGELLVYDAPWMKATPARFGGPEEVAVTRELRGRRFDAAVIFTVYTQSPLPAALLCYWAGIPLRLAHCRENPYQLLTDWVQETEPEQGIRHEVRRQLDLVEAAGCSARDERLGVRIPWQARARVRRLLRELDLDEHERWIVMHPGASAPSRRYPAELFAEAGRRLVRETGYSILLTGAEDELELVTSIQRMIKAPAYSLAGALSLADTAALLEAAPLLISNNTGPVHLAAAVGTPVVDLYALTNPQHTPWGIPHRLLYYDVPCKGCLKSVCPEGHNNCLRLVEPAQVVEAACSL